MGAFTLFLFCMLVGIFGPEMIFEPEIFCFGTFPVSYDETEYTYVIRMEDIAKE